MSAPSSSTPITALLAQWRAGDRSVEPELMRLVYPQLRQIAQARLARSPSDFTLSATELANEAYARLVEGSAMAWNDRGHFFAVAARATRDFVVDHLRSRATYKRGGDLPFVSLSDVGEHDMPTDEIDLRSDWLSVHDALNDLEGIDAACAQVVELKFFSGLTTDEIADVVGISRAGVVRQWRFARAWLFDRFRDSV